MSYSYNIVLSQAMVPSKRSELSHSRRYRSARSTFSLASWAAPESAGRMPLIKLCGGTAWERSRPGEIETVPGLEGGNNFCSDQVAVPPNKQGPPPSHTYSLERAAMSIACTITCMQ